MDLNPNHFPTLLVICTLMSIILYITSYTVYFFHQRNTLLNTNDVPISFENMNHQNENEDN